MKKGIAAAMCGLLFFALAPGVWADELLVGGQAVGIEISADGVLVSGFCEVDTPEGAVSPAREAGFAVGDLIVKMDGAEIRSAEDLIAAVARLGGAESEMEVLRGGRTQRLRVRPALSTTRQWLLGLWLRDGVSGIGTLTFIDPRSGVFGALGHSVNDENSGRAVPLRAGQISAAEIVSVSPGSPIIQDGSIVGAVTHVFVNDPRRGFAIGIYDMLGAAGVAGKAA